MTDHLAFCCYLQQSRVSPVFTGVFIVTSPDGKLTPEHSAHTQTHCTISIQDQFSLSSVDIRLNQTITSIMLRGDRPTLFTTHNSIALLEKVHSSVTQIGTHSKGCIHQSLGDGNCSLFSDWEHQDWLLLLLLLFYTKIQPRQLSY